MNLTLSELFIYPIKSLGGISLDSAEVEESGLKYDRRWLMVDKQGVFLTQRDFPQMVLLKTSLEVNGIKVINIKNGDEIIIPYNNSSDEKSNVIIWDDTCLATKISDEADDFFSRSIGVDCSLVKMAKEEQRLVEKKYIDHDVTVGFADAYPFLIIGQPSLDDLNSRLKDPLPMNRFRPNFVFTGGIPYEEDNWRKFNIGNVSFEAVKPCARCVITTTDQQTAERNEEPLKTLATYRRTGNNVLFGMNVISYNTGIVSLGDKISLF